MSGQGLAQRRKAAKVRTGDGVYQQSPRGGGLSAEVASALIADAEELVTTEKSVKPIHRVSSIKVVGLQDS